MAVHAELALRRATSTRSLATAAKRAPGRPSDNSERAAQSALRHDVSGIPIHAEQASKYDIDSGYASYLSGQHSINMCIGSNAAIQAPFVMDQPGDAHEQEADHIAAQVIRMTTPPTATPSATAELAFIQRKCACGGTCSKCEQDHTDHDGERIPSIPLVAAPTAPTTIPSTVPQRVDDELRRPGQPLDATTRATMESRFGHDFADVRIHAGADAAKSAEAIFAQAATSGRHILFGTDRYRPETTEGRLLLAHELTHVLQQRGRVSAIQR